VANFFIKDRSNVSPAELHREEERVVNTTTHHPKSRSKQANKQTKTVRLALHTCKNNKEFLWMCSCSSITTDAFVPLLLVMLFASLLAVGCWLFVGDVNERFHRSFSAIGQSEVLKRPGGPSSVARMSSGLNVGG
jgi:hypothetical protein